MGSTPFRQMWKELRIPMGAPRAKTSTRLSVMRIIQVAGVLWPGRIIHFLLHYVLWSVVISPQQNLILEIKILRNNFT